MACKTQVPVSPLNVVYLSPDPAHQQTVPRAVNESSAPWASPLVPTHGGAGQRHAGGSWHNTTTSSLTKNNIPYFDLRQQHRLLPLAPVLRESLCEESLATVRSQRLAKFLRLCLKRQAAQKDVYNNLSCSPKEKNPPV